MPGPAEAALRAWRRLHQLHLPWKPDAVSARSGRDDEDQVRQIVRAHHVANCSIRVMSEVLARGGPTNPWSVDLVRHRATFGPAEVGFYLLDGGGFSPATYRRLDRRPSPDDMLDIQDAVYCIAKAFSLARAANQALLAVAEYTRRHARGFVRTGPVLPPDNEIARIQMLIAAQADRLERLAVSAEEGGARYTQFEQVLDELHRGLAGFP